MKNTKIDRKTKADCVRRRVRALGAWMGAGILLVLGVCVGIFVYTYHHIDYAADEALFALAQGSHTTRLYYRDPEQHADGKGELFFKSTEAYLPSGYYPIEWETQRLHGATNAIWCPYEQIPQSIKSHYYRQTFTIQQNRRRNGSSRNG